MPHYCCMCSNISANLIVEFWRHLKTVHIYFGLCVSRSQLTSFLGPYWIFFLSSQWLDTYSCEYFLDIAWLRNPRASAWYLVVLHLLNVFKCHSDVKKNNCIFTMWECKGFLKSGEFGENCQRIWKLIVLKSDEFHCTQNKKAKDWLNVGSSSLTERCVVVEAVLDATKEFTGSWVRPTPSFMSESVLSLRQRGINK